MFRHRIKRSHIMQTVCNLYQNYPYVIRQCQNHLTKTLGLLGRVRPHNLADFRQSVNKRCYFRTKKIGYILHRVIGIFHHIVQKRCYSRFCTQSDLLYRNLRHCQRMQYIRLSRFTSNPLMSFPGKFKCPANHFHTLLSRPFSQRFYQIIESHFNHFLLVHNPNNFRFKILNLRLNINHKLES